MVWDDTKVANDDFLSADWNSMVTDQKARSRVYDGTVTPVGAITPEAVGDLYVDTTANAAYIATGTANTDWELIDTATIAWGSITGTLSNQTDLQDALDLKGEAIAVGLNTSKVTNQTHTGDVTGSIALTIANDKVTYAKIQNVVADDRILGNIGGAGGIVAELTKAQVLTLINVEDNADVTDTTNVTSAGALMDSEVDADIKTLVLPASTTISVYGASLIDDADAGTARGTLDVDASGTDNSTDVTLDASATTGGLSISTQAISNRAATNAQTGYMTSALVGNIETNNDKVSTYTNLTSFVSQTAWRVFYSNTSGDVTELALGADGTFLKSNGATSAPTFATPAGSGDVSKVGIPVDNQVGVWTGDGTIEGDANFTWDGTSLQVEGNITVDTDNNFQIGINTKRHDYIYAYNFVVDTSIIHNGDLDTRIDFNTNEIELVAGGVNALVANATNVTVTGNIAVTGTVDGVDIAAEETRLANTSGTNTGDQADMSAITDSKADFNTACTDGTFVYTDDFPLNQNTTGLAATATLAADSTAWITMTSVQAKWFSDAANVLTFDETELATTIEAYSYSTTVGTVTSVAGGTGLTSSGGATPSLSHDSHTGDVTGSTALTIAAKAVDVAMLADGTDGQLITWATDATATTVAAGDVGQLLISGGAGAVPAFGNLDISKDTSPDLGGELDAGAHSIGFTAQTATGDGTTTIDWKLGNKMHFTFGAANETFTFTAPSNPCNILMTMTQDGTGSRTATWPATVKWPAGTAPTLTTTASGVDVISFYWDGTNYFGVASLAFAVPA